jgi:uncharacterized membrane protein YbhN (UPF0104 family)
MSVNSIGKFIIKILVIVLSLGYIVYRLFWSENGLQEIKFTFNGTEWVYLISAFLLMPLNWALETIKWKYVIRLLHPVRFKQAVKAILIGLSVSLFTPMRITDFLGRIIVLPPDKRVQGSVLSLIANYGQTIITAVFGLFGALIFFEVNPSIDQTISESTWDVLKVISLIITLLMIVTFFFIKPILSRVGKYFRKLHLDQASAINNLLAKDLAVILLLSAARYVVFLFQASLIIMAYNIDVSFFNILLLFTLVFMTKLFLPTITLFEAGIRGSVALLIFGMVTSLTVPVISGIILVWIINIVIPSVIGLGIFYKTKF